MGLIFLPALQSVGIICDLWYKNQALSDFSQKAMFPLHSLLTRDLHPSVKIHLEDQSVARPSQGHLQPGNCTDDPQQSQLLAPMTYLNSSLFGPVWGIQQLGSASKRVKSHVLQICREL